MPTRFLYQTLEGSRRDKHAGRWWTLPNAAGDGKGIPLRRGEFGEIGQRHEGLVQR